MGRQVPSRDKVPAPLREQRGGGGGVLTSYTYIYANAKRLGERLGGLGSLSDAVKDMVVLFR